MAVKSYHHNPVLYQSCRPQGRRAGPCRPYHDESHVHGLKRCYVIFKVFTISHINSIPYLPTYASALLLLSSEFKQSSSMVIEPPTQILELFSLIVMLLLDTTPLFRCCKSTQLLFHLYTLLLHTLSWSNLLMISPYLSHFEPPAVSPVALYSQPK